MPGSASGSHSTPPEPVSEDELSVVLTPRLGPKELTTWLQNRAHSLTEVWVHEFWARGMGSAPGISEIVERFAEFLVRLVPLMRGPHQDQITPLGCTVPSLPSSGWQQARRSKSCTFCS
jgi:hypothetical protein